MAARMMLLANKNINFIDFISTGQDIGEIEISIPQRPEEIRQVFLILEDEQGLIEILEFQKDSLEKTRPNTVYKPDLEIPIRMANKNIKGKILVINPQNSTYILSNEFSAKLISKNFELARQTHLVKSLGIKIQTYYENIMNVFQQLIEKGDNTL